MTKAFKNTKPWVGLKKRRKGSKNIFIPYKIYGNRRKHLGAKLMLNNIFSKKPRYIYQGIVEELINSALNKSEAIKERFKIHEEAFKNIKNIRFIRVAKSKEKPKDKFEEKFTLKRKQSFMFKARYRETNHP